MLKFLGDKQKNGKNGVTDKQTGQKLYVPNVSRGGDIKGGVFMKRTVLLFDNITFIHTISLTSMRDGPVYLYCLLHKWILYKGH